MGYRSDVGIVVAFKTREDMEKVIATYKMNPDVQRLDLFAEWSMYEGKDVYFLQYKNSSSYRYKRLCNIQVLRM